MIRAWRRPLAPWTRGGKRAPAWRLLPAETPLDALGLVVVDLETTGLDPARDVVLSVSATTIQGMGIDLGRSFEVTVRQPVAMEAENVLAHGITPQAVAAGVPPPDALRAFLRFWGGWPLVAFHCAFDKAVLERALHAHLGGFWKLPFTEAEDWAVAFLLAGDERPGALDGMLARYGLDASQRLHAPVGALSTAELVLMALHRAREQGVRTWGGLEARLREARGLTTVAQP